MRCEADKSVGAAFVFFVGANDAFTCGVQRLCVRSDAKPEIR